MLPLKPPQSPVLLGAANKHVATLKAYPGGLSDRACLNLGASGEATTLNVRYWH